MRANGLGLIGCLSIALLLWGAGCRAKPGSSAADHQRLNRAMAYFLYAQANLQLTRLPPGFRMRMQDANARTWVIRGLRVPEREVAEQTIGGGVSFVPGMPLTGSWTRHYVDNPHAAVADSLIQLFNDAPAIWDLRERRWHLPREYKSDYEWARNEDGLGFAPAFYQDPYPRTAGL